MRLLLAAIISSSFLMVIATPLLYSASGAPQGVQSKIPSADKTQQEQKQKEMREKKQESQQNAQQLLEQRIRRIRETSRGQNQQQSAGLTSEGKEYPYPGIVVFNGQDWQGSDNTYNISKFIAVGADISVDANDDEIKRFPIKAAETRERVKAIFQNAGIFPYANNNNSLPGAPTPNNTGAINAYAMLKPPLPLFMVVVIAQPINKGYAVYCSANLFEEVDVKRALYGEGTWQAITWERQHLIVGSSEEIGNLVNKCIDDVAYSFVKVFRYFEYARPAR